MDYLGSVERVDLYSALVVDSKSKPAARLLLRAALTDPEITEGQRKDLSIIFFENFGQYGERTDGG